MPVRNRRDLRQRLGTDYIGDMVSSLTMTTTGTIVSAGVFGVAFYNGRFSDSPLNGQGLYENAQIWHLSGAYDYRVSSFNAGSGAFFTSQVLENAITPNDEFEVHTRIRATDKNNAIDDTLKTISVRQEVGIGTGTAGADFFSIEGAASPHYISDVLDAYWFAQPNGSLDRDLQRFSDFRIVTTASGREIRVSPAPGGSAQLVLDAILTLTLGSAEGATINIPDEAWLLSGAAARCYNLLIQRSPGQNTGDLKERRAEWATTFTRLSALQTRYDRKVRLGEPEDQTSLAGLLTW